MGHLTPISMTSMSLSARRAWIEMVAACPFSCWGAVALRKESVDRNSIGPGIAHLVHTVALRKESVDRNKAIILAARLRGRRSPQGERG